MTRTRPSPRLTKKQRRRLSDFNTEAEQQHAERRARQSKGIRALQRRGPAQLLAILNAPGPSPTLLQLIQRLGGRPSAPGPYDEKLVMLAWLFCRAFALLSMRLPLLRRNARAPGLEAAGTA